MDEPRAPLADRPGPTLLETKLAQFIIIVLGLAFAGAALVTGWSRPVAAGFLGVAALFAWFAHQRSGRLKMILLAGMVVCLGVTLIVVLWPRPAAEGIPRANRPEGQAAPSPTPDTTYDGGWGPERKTYTEKAPSDKPAFNSIRDHPVHGDERNFVQYKPQDADNASTQMTSSSRSRRSSSLYVFLENASTRPGADLKDVTFSLVGETTAEDPGIGVQLDASNAGTVWDGCRVFGHGKLQLTYIPKSATLTYGDVHATKTMKMTDGAVHGNEPFPSIGVGQGVIPASNHSLGWVNLQVLAETQ